MIFFTLFSWILCCLVPSAQLCGLIPLQMDIEAAQTYCIFPYDFHFIQRVALVESDYGCNQPNPKGGMFQMTKEQVNLVSTKLPQELKSDIYKHLGVDVTAVNFDNGDLNKSAVVVVEFLSYIYLLQKDIPVDIEAQANLWSVYRNGSRNPSEFMDKTAGLSGKCLHGSHAGDIVFIIDASNSLMFDDDTGKNYDQVKEFIIQFVNNPNLSITKYNYRVGIVIFSKTATTFVNISSVQTKPWLLNFLTENDLPFYGSVTNLEAGLSEAEKVFQNGRMNDHSDAFPLVGILISDGYPTFPTPTDNAESKALEAATNLKTNVTLYTVGIGKNVDSEFLKRISKGCNYNFNLDSYENLGSGFATELLLQTCNTEAKIALKNGVIESVIEENESRFYVMNVDVNSILTLNISTNVGACAVYVSKQFPNPSEEMHDFAINGTTETVGHIVLSPDYLQSKVSRMSQSASIHISVVGKEAENNFSLVYATSDAGKIPCHFIITDRTRGHIFEFQ